MELELCILGSVQDNLVPPGPILQKFFDPTDCGRACPRLLGDLGVGLRLAKQTGHLQPLGQRLELPDRGDVLQKVVDLLACLELQKSVAEFVRKGILPIFRTGMMLPWKAAGSLQATS